MMMKSVSLQRPGSVRVARSARSSTVRVNALFGAKEAAPANFYDITVKDIDGKEFPMSKLKGKTVLFVNLASACGLTPQYADLAKLYDKYSSKGFVIVGQPCNQFGGQEPGSNDEVKKFASSRGARFPILAKADVNGGSATPLYQWLRSQKGGMLGNNISWNFEKFLVSKDGQVINRYAPTTNPMDLSKDIEANI